jgi:hypothetical protein
MGSEHIYDSSAKWYHLTQILFYNEAWIFHNFMQYCPENEKQNGLQVFTPWDIKKHKSDCRVLINSCHCDKTPEENGFSEEELFRFRVEQFSSWWPGIK